MKVGHIEHETEDGLLVKIFVIPDVPPNEKDDLGFEIARQVKQIREQTARLQATVFFYDFDLGVLDSATYYFRRAFRLTSFF